jgi:hypothetical protein
MQYCDRDYHRSAIGCQFQECHTAYVECLLRVLQHAVWLRSQTIQIPSTCGQGVRAANHESQCQSHCFTRIPYTLCLPLCYFAFRIPHQAPEIILPLQWYPVSCSGSSCIPGHGARVWSHGCGICEHITSSGLLRPRR